MQKLEQTLPVFLKISIFREKIEITIRDGLIDLTRYNQLYLVY